MGLSPNAQEALKVLAQTDYIASPAAKKILNTIPLEEQVPVMEGLINHLRQISDWNKKPNGFAGACLLANSSTEASKLLSRYVRGISNQPPWLKTMLKDQSWYKET